MLKGKVYKHEDDAQHPVTAKVTISNLNGETLSWGFAASDGTFEFNAIEPGYYTIVGIDEGYYGMQTVNVKSHGEEFTSTVPVQVEQGAQAEDVYAALQDAPLATLSTTPVGSQGQEMQARVPFVESYPSSGFSSGGGYSSSGFSSGGGGRIRGRRGLRRLWPLVGLVGLTAIDGDDDASPDM